MGLGNESILGKKYLVYFVKSPYSESEDDAWLCAGAIVSPTQILTAAACLVNVNNIYAIAGYKKYVHAKDIEKDKCANTCKKKVVKISVPKEYTASNAKELEWLNVDIGVATVQEPYDFNDQSYLAHCSYVPESININYDKANEVENTRAIALGWGGTGDKAKAETEEKPKLLKEATTNIIEKTFCIRLVPKIESKELVEKYILCASGNGFLGDEADETTSDPSLEKQSSNSSISNTNDSTKNIDESNKMSSRKSSLLLETCQNDHGSPLTTWVGAEEVILGVALNGICNPNFDCVGPRIYVSTVATANIIKCLLETNNTKRKICNDQIDDKRYQVNDIDIQWPEDLKKDSTSSVSNQKVLSYRRKNNQEDTFYVRPTMNLQSVDEPQNLQNNTPEQSQESLQREPNENQHNTQQYRSRKENFQDDRELNPVYEPPSPPQADLTGEPVNKELQNQPKNLAKRFVSQKREPQSQPETNYFNKPEQEYQNKPEVDTANQPQMESYNQPPLDPYYNQPPMDSFNNQPQTESKNPPETDPYNQPQTESNNPPETDPYNQPQTESKNPPETDPYNQPQTESKHPPETDPYNQPQTESKNPPETDPYNQPQTKSKNPPETDPYNQPQIKPKNQPPLQPPMDSFNNQPQSESKNPPDTDPYNQPQTESNNPPETDPYNQPQTKSKNPPETDPYNQPQIKPKNQPPVIPNHQNPMDQNNQQLESFNQPSIASKNLPQLKHETKPNNPQRPMNKYNQQRPAFEPPQKEQSQADSYNPPQIESFGQPLLRKPPPKQLNNPPAKSGSMIASQSKEKKIRNSQYLNKGPQSSYNNAGIETFHPEPTESYNPLDIIMSDNEDEELTFKHPFKQPFKRPPVERYKLPGADTYMPQSFKPSLDNPFQQPYSSQKYQAHSPQRAQPLRQSGLAPGQSFDTNSPLNTSRESSAKGEPQTFEQMFSQLYAGPESNMDGSTLAPPREETFDEIYRSLHDGRPEEPLDQEYQPQNEQPIMQEVEQTDTRMVNESPVNVEETRGDAVQVQMRQQAPIDYADYRIQ